MFVVELSFAREDNERLAARAAHRERLVQLYEQGRVRMAGPLADDSGALIVFDVPDRSTLDELLAVDPYFALAGVKVTGIRDWHPFLPS